MEKVPLDHRLFPHRLLDHLHHYLPLQDLYDGQILHPNLLMSIEDRPDSGQYLQTEQFDQFDKEVYEIDKVVYETEQGKKLPEKRRTDYPEVTFPLTATEQQLQDDWDLEHGMTTLAEIMRRRDPDGFKDDEEAQKEIDKNLEANKEVKTRATDTPEEGITFSRGR